MRNRPYLTVCSTVLIMSLLTGCSDPKLHRLTEDLSTTSQGASTKVKVFYDDLKETNRQMYVSEVRAQPLAKTTVDEARPGPSNPLNQDDVQRRVEVAANLEDVCQQLNNVASSKNIDDANKAIDVLNQKLQGLGKTALVAIPIIQKLQSIGLPLTSFLKLVVHGGFGFYADKWVRQTVDSTDKAFGLCTTALFAQLNTDAGNTRLRASKLVGLWRQAQRNIETSHGSAADQAVTSNELDKATRWEQQVGGNNPAPLFQQLRSTFHDLAGYVRQKLPANKGGQ